MDGIRLPFTRRVNQFFGSDSSQAPFFVLFAFFAVNSTAQFRLKMCGAGLPLRLGPQPCEVRNESTLRSNATEDEQSGPARQPDFQVCASPPCKRRCLKQPGRPQSKSVILSCSGRTTDFFGVGGRLSLTPRFSEVGVAREQAPQPLQRFTVAGNPLKRFRPRDHRPHPTQVGC